MHSISIYLPEDLWKQQVLANFTAEEITNAKNALWDVGNTNDLLGRNIVRKGDSKSASEISDICTALKSLSEKQKMPVFIATSTMVMQSPETNGDSNQKLQCLFDNLQDHIDKSLQKQSDQSSRNHDRVISKAEVGQKKIDDALKKLDVIDGNITGSSVAEIPLQQSPVVTRPNERLTTTHNNQINQRNLLSKTNHITHISALRPNEKIDLVIKGLSVDVTGEKLSGYLQSKGININECNLLTTFNNARSLAYKITVGAEIKDVVSDPSLWPENVIIQSYKQRRRSSSPSLKKLSGNNGIVRVTDSSRTKRSVVSSNGSLSVRFENTGTGDSQVQSQLQ